MFHVICFQDVVSRKAVDDEWYRRRSERIFLHEASAGSSSSQTVPVTGHRSIGDERSLSAFPSKPSTKPQRTLSQELGLKALSSSQKSELSATLKTCLPENKQVSNLKCHIHVITLHFSSSSLSCNWRFWSPLIKMHCSKKMKYLLNSVASSWNLLLLVVIENIISTAFIHWQASIPRKQASYSSDTDVNSDADDVPLSTLVHKESALG